jgi:hypothetical protein
LGIAEGVRKVRGEERREGGLWFESAEKGMREGVPGARIVE